MLLIASKAMVQIVYSQAAATGKPMPGWAVPWCGTEDLWKGDRQFNVRDADLPFNVVTYVRPDEGRVYIVVYGLIFGMASSVNQFNRVPTFLVGITRIFNCGSALLRRLWADRLGNLGPNSQEAIPPNTVLPQH